MDHLATIGIFSGEHVSFRGGNSYITKSCPSNFLMLNSIIQMLSFCHEKMTPQQKAILWQPKEHQAWGLVYLAEESLKSRARGSNQPPTCWSNGSNSILHTHKWCQLLLAIRAPIPNYINSTRGVKHFGWYHIVWSSFPSFVCTVLLFFQL